jgi:4-hydroxy-tetrahydrodipicolinate synthase
MESSGGSSNGFNRMVDAVNKLRARLEGGLLPAVPIPFHTDGRLHSAAQAAYLRYMSEQSVAGVAVWAHTGRGLLLDEEMALVVLKDWRAALADKVIIAGAGASNSDNSRGAESPEKATARAVDMAERAAKAGADALLVYAPAWLRGHPQMEKLIVEHHKALASVGLPLLLFYLYESAGGIDYSSAVLEELLAYPSVAGIKVATLDSVMTYQDTARLLASRFPDKLLITGEDRFLGYSLRLGARAALIGMGAICCSLQAELIDSHLQGDAGRFLALSDLADRLAETIFINPMEGYIKRLLWGLVHLGIIPLEAANDPWGPQLSRHEFEEIGRILVALNGSI